MKNRRLLILNGLALAGDIVKAANDKGIYTIVADKDESAPAKKHARETSELATDDIEGIVRMARERNVQGVITGFVDSNLHAARIICERLNLPFYATKEQLDITMNKDKFKNLCREYDVPVVPQYSPKDDIPYPVLLKPVDNTGSRGISICYKPEDFAAAYEKALNNSASKRVLIEKFMNLDTPGVNLDYVISDGEIHLSAVGDLYAYQRTPYTAPISCAVSYPSANTGTYIEKMDGKVKKMFKGAGLKNGTLFIQSFFQDGLFYFYEMGYRLGGGQSYRVISRLNGINHLDMLIDYALTGVMCDEKTEERINPFFNKQGFILILIIKPGRIKKIQGLSKISKIPQVVNVMQAYKEGDLIPPSAVGTTRQGFGRIHLVANTKEEMADAIAKIKESLFIEDCKGESMLLDTFDERRLLAGSSLYPVKAPGVPMPISPTLL